METYEIAFVDHYGEDNLSLLYTELGMHHETQGAFPPGDGKLFWALYSAIRHQCLKESNLGDLDECDVATWVHCNINYQLLSKTIGVPYSQVSSTFMDAMSENGEDNEVYDDVDEEEEKAPVVRGISKFDYLLGT